MRLESIAGLLVTAGLGTLGTNLFIYSMPDTVDAGILLRQGLRGTDIDHELPGKRRGEFQLIVRANDYVAGHALIRLAMAALTLPERTELADRVVNFQRPRHEPLVYQRSLGNGIEMAVYFDTDFVELP